MIDNPTSDAATAPPRSGGRPPRSMREAGKRALRHYGVVTSPLRPLPDFLIIGAKRGGTTSLWNFIVRHPHVVPPFPSRERIKGTAFFEKNFHRGVHWYRSHFPTALYRMARGIGRARPVAGEASPYYLFHPHAPARAARVVPEAKLVVILRNPVDRAYSHYRERVRHGAEWLTFEEAIDQEAGRLTGEVERMLEDQRYVSFPHEHLSYVLQGRYVEMLERWLAVFPREQFLILTNEDLDRNPRDVLGRLFSFLGVPRWEPPDLQRYNYHPGEAMGGEIRERLVREFEPYNARLEALLGWNLSTWNA
jgi:Sulfotransferase domain